MKPPAPARRYSLCMTGRDDTDAGDEAGPTDDAAGTGRRFLSVWYQCCHTYGRLYRDAAGTRYEGRCPRCGARAQALIGPGGTNQRIFRAY